MLMRDTQPGGQGVRSTASHSVADQTDSVLVLAGQHTSRDAPTDGRRAARCRAAWVAGEHARDPCDVGRSGCQLWRGVRDMPDGQDVWAA